MGHLQTRGKTPPNKGKKHLQTRGKNTSKQGEKHQQTRKTPFEQGKRLQTRETPFEQEKRLSSKGYLPIKCKSLQVVGVFGQGKAVVSDGG
jgi:hypothetical protein